MIKKTTKIKKTKGEQTFSVFNWILLGVIGIVCLYPMIYVLFASLSDSNALMAHEGLLLKPLGFNISSYKKVIENPMILIGYKNTLFVLIVGLLVNMVMTTLGAYFLARKNVYFKNLIMGLILFTMYFSGGLIPTYMIVKNLGLDDSLLALILPTAVSTYNMIIMRTGFAGIPETLHEAATVDGANELLIMTRIYLPLAKATIAVIVLYYAVTHWNSWFNAAIYLNSREKFPLQLVLREILISNDLNTMSDATSASDVESIAMSIKYATIMVATVPILIVYPFVQKYFVGGIMIGSVKG